MAKFKKGDVVKRTGETRPSFGMVQGHVYTVETTEDEDYSQLVKLKGVDGAWHSHAFEMVSAKPEGEFKKERSSIRSNITTYRNGISSVLEGKKGQDVCTAREKAIMEQVVKELDALIKKLERPVEEEPRKLRYLS